MKKISIVIGCLALALFFAYKFAHPFVFVDHGVTRRSYLPALVNMVSYGRIKTVADALKLLNIPLTARQAVSIPLCEKLSRAMMPIAIKSDPYQRGIASWYGEDFHGRLAASGEIYNMYSETAAHKTLPLGSMVRVVSKYTNNSVVVRINDRGPYVGGRIIDLSYRAKELLGMGDLASVYLERLDPDALDVECK